MTLAAITGTAAAANRILSFSRFTAPRWCTSAASFWVLYSLVAYVPVCDHCTSLSECLVSPIDRVRRTTIVSTDTNGLESCENTEDLVARISLVAPRGTPAAGAAVQAELRILTQKLIASYRRDGKLLADPFLDARTRTIHVAEPEVREALEGNTVLVTGGSGCVGRALIAKLRDYRPRRIICVDWAATAPPGVIHYRVDIRDRRALTEAFERERPGVVFHLAAQRNPGLAERRVHETITTNVLGSANVIQACDTADVDVCVYSSTGKASRYLTNEVYAGSKKLSEWQMAIANRQGHTRYVLARFTHVLDNSLVCTELSDAITAAQPVGVHAPNRYVVAQNAREAAQLLLNCAVGAAPNRIRLAVVRNLGWPVETLEMALYLIRESGLDLPVYFLGCPRGYWEDFFRGQVDWRDPVNLHPLLNVLESPARRIDPSGTVIWTELEEIDAAQLDAGLVELYDAAFSPPACDENMRAALASVSTAMCRSSLNIAKPSDVLNILYWGVAPKYVEWGASGVLFEPLVEILSHALHGRLCDAVIRQSALTGTDSQVLIDTLNRHGHPIERTESELALAPTGGH